MTHQAPPAPTPSGADPGRQVAQLREALRLVERIAGHADVAGHDQRLDEAARVSGAYDRALPIVQRRFDTRAAEAAGWAAAGVEALLAGDKSAPPRAAAARLARQLEQAIAALGALLPQDG
jgi:hypothetical protein